MDHCVVEASFAPTRKGSAAAILTTSDSYPNYGTLTSHYSLLGTGGGSGSGPNLSLVRGGLVASGNGSLTFTNLGPTTASITGVGLGGASPQDFSVGSIACTQPPNISYPATLPSIFPGIQCTAPLNYTATQPGFTTATAYVTDSNSGQQVLTTLCIETLPTPSVAPALLAFPDTTVGSFSPSRSVAVTRPVGDTVHASASSGIVPTKGNLCVW